ncbi:Restriction endonuclease subunit M [Arachis hypogaea]|nr:Restriction endonuclease subunit M [Arachis hypogaea]
MGKIIEQDTAEGEEQGTSNVDGKQREGDCHCLFLSLCHLSRPLIFAAQPASVAASQPASAAAAQPASAAAAQPASATTAQHAFAVAAQPASPAFY